MKCPVCGHPVNEVTDSRDAAAGTSVRRRRRCTKCRHRWTTFERTSEMDLEEAWRIVTITVKRGM